MMTVLIMNNPVTVVSYCMVSILKKQNEQCKNWKYLACFGYMCVALFGIPYDKQSQFESEATIFVANYSFVLVIWIFGNFKSGFSGIRCFEFCF